MSRPHQRSCPKKEVQLWRLRRVRSRTPNEDEAEEMAGPRGGACSRWAASGAEADAQGCGGTRTPDATTAKEDANNRDGGFGERERPTFAGSNLDHRSHAEPKGYRTGHAFATSRCAQPRNGKFVKFCFLSICIVAWLCSHARPGRHWPT